MSDNQDKDYYIKLRDFDPTTDYRPPPKKLLKETSFSRFGVKTYVFFLDDFQSAA